MLMLWPFFQFAQLSKRQHLQTGCFSDSCSPADRGGPRPAQRGRGGRAAVRTDGSARDAASGNHLPGSPPPRAATPAAVCPARRRPRPPSETQLPGTAPRPEQTPSQAAPVLRDRLKVRGRAGPRPRHRDTGEPQGPRAARQEPRGAEPGQPRGAPRKGRAGGGHPETGLRKRGEWSPKRQGLGDLGREAGRGPGCQGPRGARPAGGGLAGPTGRARRGKAAGGARSGAGRALGGERPEPGTRAGGGTHRARGGAGQQGAGRVLSPQAGLEALHGPGWAVPLPAGAPRLLRQPAGASAGPERAEERAVPAPPAT